MSIKTYCNIIFVKVLYVIIRRRKYMIKINLKNGGLAEKPKVIIDGNVVGKVASGNPFILDLDIRQTYFRIRGDKWKKSTNRSELIR